MHAKARYNRRKYKTILYRVPRDSELAARLCAQCDNGESVNFLITRLLCEFYGVKPPQKTYITRETRPIE
jgi:hypothetical protein